MSEEKLPATNSQTALTPVQAYPVDANKKEHPNITWLRHHQSELATATGGFILAVMSVANPIQLAVVFVASGLVFAGTVKRKNEVARLEEANQKLIAKDVLVQPRFVELDLPALAQKYKELSAEESASPTA